MVQHIVMFKFRADVPDALRTEAAAQFKAGIEALPAVIPFIREVKVGHGGYVAEMDTMALGLAAQAMGAGRIRKTDALDYSVGFVLPVRIGDRVQPEDTLCIIHARSEAEADQAEAAIRAAIRFSDAPVQAPPLWYAIITRDGVVRC